MAAVSKCSLSKCFKVFSTICILEMIKNTHLNSSTSVVNSSYSVTQQCTVASSMFIHSKWCTLGDYKCKMQYPCAFLM